MEKQRPKAHEVKRTVENWIFDSRANGGVTPEKAELAWRLNYGAFIRVVGGMLEGDVSNWLAEHSDHTSEVPTEIVET